MRRVIGGLGVLLAALLVVLVVALAPLRLAGAGQGSGASGRPGPSETPPAATPLPGRTTPYRAVWVSYLEWQQMDFSTAETFALDAGQMMDHIAALGATVVLAQVRPFGDALYPSEYYPFSHLCTGTQGQDPGYDPLELLIQAAHDRGLELEAWINPYRLQVNGVPALCDGSPARRHPEWVRPCGSDLYLNPADPAVRDFLAGAVEELCAGYDIDGIHFDDYFYPTSDPAFDKADYTAAGTVLALDDWRRANVNALMAACHAVTQAYGVRFGAAPLADLDLCRDGQYSDAALWLAQSGYVDYLMPQFYWGLTYAQDGSDAHALGTLAAQWAALPRDPRVALYGGLGAYRIGAGDGSDGPAGEWTSGHALADQLAALADLGFDGAGLYRYASLWANPQWPDLAGQEREAVAARWALTQNSGC